MRLFLLNGIPDSPLYCHSGILKGTFRRPGIRSSFPPSHSCFLATVSGFKSLDVCSSYGCLFFSDLPRKDSRGDEPRFPGSNPWMFVLLMGVFSPRICPGKTTWGEGICPGLPAGRQERHSGGGI